MTTLPETEDVFLRNCCGTYPQGKHAPWCTSKPPESEAVFRTKLNEPIEYATAAEAAARHAAFQEAIARSSQNIAEAAEYDRIHDRMNPCLPLRRLCCGTVREEDHRTDCPAPRYAKAAPTADREPVRLRDVLQQLEQVLAPVSAGVIADARRQRDEALALGNRFAGLIGDHRAGAEHWAEENPGLAQLLEMIDS